jgi:hypothetical protein
VGQSTCLKVDDFADGRQRERTIRMEFNGGGASRARSGEQPIGILIERGAPPRYTPSPSNGADFAVQAVNRDDRT